MKEFDTKEKEYIDWIHHLEIQLKEKSQAPQNHQVQQVQQQVQQIQQIQQVQQVQQAQTKSKRMIEVTHIQSTVYKR